MSAGSGSDTTSSQTISARLKQCKAVLEALKSKDATIAEQFVIVEEWAKIKHVVSGHEILPDKFQTYIASPAFKNLANREKIVPVEDPSHLSGFLRVYN